MCCCQTYLVTVARVARSCLCRDDTLRELTLHSLGYALIDVARTRYTHSLIDVASAREWVADSSAQAGRSTTKRLNLSWVVVCLVLELKQPLLLDAIHIDIDKYRAGVILLALLQVVEYARLLQITCTDCCKLHQTEALLLSAELLTYAVQSLQRLLQLLLEERLVDCYLLNLGCKSGVAAVVAPIGIEYAKLGLRWVALLTLVILHHLTQIIGIHRQTILLAEWL